MSYIIWVYHVYHWDPFSSSPIGKPLRDDVVLWKADLVLYLKARAIKHCGNLVRTHLVTPLTDMFRKNYCNASNWGLVTRLYTYFRSNSAPHMVMTGDYMPQTEWPTCVCASQLGIFIHKFITDGNIYFISLDLSICWRWCWFLAIFEALRSH